MAELTQEEINERVALLKRFKSLLEQQRNKFQEYLNVLEKQEDSISSQNADSLIAHTELEQQVVKNIANLQKVIVPMTKIYKSSLPLAHTDEEASIRQIQKELNTLQDKVLKQNQVNRDLLRVHIETIRAQIQNFKNPYKNNRSVYAQPKQLASLVEVEA